MTHVSSNARPAGQSKGRTNRRATWLKTSIVAGSIAATLAGTQGIAWLEAQRSATSAALAAISTPAVTEIAPDWTAIAVPADVQPITPVAGAGSAAVSLFAVLPTVTPTAATADAVALADVALTATPVPTATAAPTATPSPTVVQAPSQTQPGRVARPLANSRSSR